MFIGHFGLGFAVKKVAPEISLGTLFMSVQFLDLEWPMFLMLGLEHVRIDPGNTAMTPLDFYDYPITHSLVGAVAWAAGFGMVYWLVWRRAGAAVVLGVGVLSHWLLDVMVHRPDLPVLPHGPFLGLGLWNFPAATLAVELALFLAGVALYVRVSSARRDRIGHYGLWSLVLFLIGIHIGNVVGPPPPNVTAVAVLGLAQWLVVAWAYWVDRHRMRC